MTSKQGQKEARREVRGDKRNRSFLTKEANSSHRSLGLYCQERDTYSPSPSPPQSFPKLCKFSSHHRRMEVQAGGVIYPEWYSLEGLELGFKSKFHRLGRLHSFHQTSMLDLYLEDRSRLEELKLKRRGSGRMLWVSLGLHVTREDNALECVATNWVKW